MASIKKDMIRGLFWSAVEKYSSFFVSLIISVILARLLSPKEFGLIAIATVLIQFLSIFSTMGIGPAIIQRNDLDKEDLNSIYTITLIAGLFISAFFVAASPLIANYYDNRQLISVCSILSVIIFFSSANMVPNSLMAKNKRFKEMAKRTLLFQITTGVISVFVAFCGGGIYSLLITPVVTSVGVFYYNKHFYPLSINRNLSLRPIKKISSYSSYLFFFEIINFWGRNLDKLIIGKFMSSELLGHYDKSYRLVQMPQAQITSVINPVLQPVLSSLQKDLEIMSNKYNQIIYFVSTISFPLAITLNCCGTEIINIMYGGQWDAAIPTFKILALSLATQIILSTSGAIWQSSNATKYMFWTGLANNLLTISAFVIGTYYWGNIEAVAWGWTITAFINFMTTYYFMYVKLFRVSFLGMLATLVSPLINMFILHWVLFYIDLFFNNLSLLMLLVLKISVSFLVTILYIQLTHRYNLLEIIKKTNEKDAVL